MQFGKLLQEGQFIKRYKRFFADIEYQGKVITAHVPNTGSLKSCQTPGARCLFSVSDDPNRKLPYTLEMIRTPNDQAWIGVNTGIPNKIVKEAIEQKLFPWWLNFDVIKPEAKINAETRLDFCLTNSQSQKLHYIEVKNVTLVEGRVAQFPDAVSERAQKHIHELMRLHEAGHSVEILFTIQRPDADFFAPAKSIDPVYAELLENAVARGLRVTPALARVSPEGIVLSDKLLTLQF